MKKFGAVALIALFGAAPAAFAGTINVPGDFPTIQQAIDAAVNGDLVKVGNGTFTENIDLKGKAITIRGNGINKTTISGANGGSTVTIKSGETAATRLEDFAIKFGTGTLVSTKLVGGGIYMTGGSDPTLDGIAVGFNMADLGAGIYIDVGSDPLIQDCLVANNVTHSKGTGAGLYIAGNPTLDANRITENTATSGTGGGAYVVNSTASFTNNEIDKNHAYWGGGISVYGGSPSITDNLFEENEVLGAPVNGEGAGLYLTGKSTAWVNNNEFQLNDAHTGAGVYAYDADANVVDNLLHDNYAATNGSGGFGYGGGMSLGKNRGTVELNEIYYNDGALGGGVALRKDTTTLVYGNVIDHNDTGMVGLGGGIYALDATSFILANTIAANNASKGGGVYATGKKAPSIDTSIIFFNTAGSGISFFDTTGKLTFGFSDVEAASVGGSSISIDPAFNDLSNRDFRLQASSPVIDAGNFSFSGGPNDIYGNTRVGGGRVDMGAAEF